MVLKTVIILGGTLATYLAIMFGGFTPIQMLALCVLLGVFIAGIGFSVAHDALHGAYSKNARVNQFLGYSFDLLGANSYMWKITHNVIHHTYTNIDGIDEDLTVSPILRLSPGAPRRPVPEVSAPVWLPCVLLCNAELALCKGLPAIPEKGHRPVHQQEAPAQRDHPPDLGQKRLCTST